MTLNNNNNDILQDIHSYGASLNCREIFLHNYFDQEENPGVEYRMASIFIKNLRILEQKSSAPVRIHMNSIGGNWSDGMAIYDAIRMSQCYITIVAYGQAESMSSIILQAADERVITANSYFMLHYGSSGVEADYQSSQNWMKYEKHICEVMLDIYANRCLKGKFFKEKYAKPDLTKVRNFVSKKLKDGDWYLTADETVHYGFADRIIKSI